MSFDLMHVKKNGLCVIKCNTCGAVHENMCAQNIYKSYRDKPKYCSLCGPIHQGKRQKSVPQKPVVPECNINSTQLKTMSAADIAVMPLNVVKCRRCHKVYVNEDVGFCDACLKVVAAYRHRMGHANYSGAVQL